jgi:trans-aconitate methyltransferase
MSTASSGHYPIERREGEIERLHVQAAAMAPDCAVMLDRIGVSVGWHCLDVGCGPGGITHLMSERVGASGRVVGLDADPVFIEHAQSHPAANVEFVTGNAYQSKFPAGSSISSTCVSWRARPASPRRCCAKRSGSRPGGTVALQEPDMASLNCYPPHPAWERLKTALQGAFTSVGADINIARRLYGLARNAGLADVQYRPFVIGVRSIDPIVDYLPSTVESLRGTIVSRGLMSADELDSALADCRAHLRDPGTVFTMYTVAQVWGRTAAASIGVPRP